MAGDMSNCAVISDILSEVLNERERQDVLKAEGKFKKTCADGMSNAERLAVLAEEFGEVAREVCEQIEGFTDWYKMRTELIQVAAVCVAWVEGLDKQKTGGK
jgi:NTP pyrophosphatase (non-canonical NTP hydrolase)